MASTKDEALTNAQTSAKNRRIEGLVVDRWRGREALPYMYHNTRSHVSFSLTTTSSLYFSTTILKPFKHPFWSSLSQMLSKVR
ncbi:hypothetical protein RJT34_30226 [Clitoria ternatea]|uniref:Uncharacterized protein n=1 Tax=Clitoria ternatea TaxID=43366 RepID=A0AAN9EU74_CLITE